MLPGTGQNSSVVAQDCILPSRGFPIRRPLVKSGGVENPASSRLEIGDTIDLEEWPRSPMARWFWTAPTTASGCPAICSPMMIPSVPKSGMPTHRSAIPRASFTISAVRSERRSITLWKARSNWFDPVFPCVRRVAGRHRRAASAVRKRFSDSLLKNFLQNGAGFARRFLQE